MPSESLTRSPDCSQRTAAIVDEIRIWGTKSGGKQSAIDFPTVTNLNYEDYQLRVLQPADCAIAAHSILPEIAEPIAVEGFAKESAGRQAHQYAQ
jgi:hypothetical protein